MALMTCPDCGRECSTSAAQCPHCGRPIGRQRQQEGFLHKVGRFIWFFVLAIVIGSCVMCGVCNNTPISNTSTPSRTTTPSPTSTPKVQDSLNNAPRISDPLNMEGNTVNNSSSGGAMPPLPYALSSKENLEAGKKALSQGDLSTARIHLSAIPKGSSEYASAKQFLAKLEASEQRAQINDELQKLADEAARKEELLDQTENMEGSIGKSIYLNALKRKGEIQLRRIELERKLKRLK